MQILCFAFRYRTRSNMIMKRYETLNSIHPVRLSTFVTFWHSVWSNTSKNWKFRGPAKTSDFVKTHCKLLAIELLSDARLSCCTHVLYTTWNFLFGGYCQVDGILCLLPAELRRKWSETAVFQFWRKVDFWQNWCANIALFERFAFRYHHFNNMGHEANWIPKRLHMVRLSTFLLLSFDAGSRMSEIKKIVWSRQNVILLKTLCKLYANTLLCVSISDWFKYDYETIWNAE